MIWLTLILGMLYLTYTVAVVTLKFFYVLILLSVQVGIWVFSLVMKGFQKHSAAG